MKAHPANAVNKLRPAKKSIGSLLNEVHGCTGFRSGMRKLTVRAAGAGQVETYSIVSLWLCRAGNRLGEVDVHVGAR